MRYIADSAGYVKELSFGADIACGGDTCTEYTGAVPSGYKTLEAWYIAECERLYRWKIVDGNLTLDSTAVAPSAEKPKHIIDSGVTTGWTYVKYNDGSMRFWKIYDANFTFTAAGNLYRSAGHTIALPPGFGLSPSNALGWAHCGSSAVASAVLGLATTGNTSTLYLNKLNANAAAHKVWLFIDKIV